MPSDVTGSSIFNQRDGRLRVPAGPDLHEPPARRRDQPRPAEDAGGAARGDAGAAGDDRGHDAPARAAVPRARDAEPDRVRGHVPAARGAARPLPAPASASAIRRARTSGRCSSAGSSARSTRSSSTPVVDGDDAARDAARARGRARRRSDRPLHGRPRRGDAHGAAASRSARARAARSRCSSSRAAARRSQGRDFVTPDDVKAVAVPALAHRLTLRPELWVQRVRAEDVVRERLEPVPTPAAEPAPAVNRTASPKLRAYAALAALGLLAALVLGRPELAALAAPFASSSPSRGLARRASRSCERRLVLDRERALEGDEVVLDGRARRARAGRAPRAAARASRRVCRPTGRIPSLIRLGGTGSGGRSSSRSRASAGAPTSSAACALRAQDRSGLLAYGSGLDRRSRSRSTRGARASRAARARSRRRSSPATRSRARRARASSSPTCAVRARRPRAADQLARERAPRRALGQRAAPGAEHRRDPLPRHLRRGAARRAGHARRSPCARPPRSPTATCGAKDRVGLVGFGGVLHWLLPGSTGSSSSTGSSTRCSTRRSCLSYAWKDIDVIPPRTLPPQALVLALTPLLDERAVAALLDLRARGFDLAIVEVSPAAVRRAGRDRRAERLAYRLWQLQREALRARYQRAGRPGRRVARRRAARGCARGGEEIQAPRPSRPRLSYRSCSVGDGSRPRRVPAAGGNAPAPFARTRSAAPRSHSWRLGWPVAGRRRLPRGSLSSARSTQFCSLRDRRPWTSGRLSTRPASCSAQSCRSGRRSRGCRRGAIWRWLLRRLGTVLAACLGAAGIAAVVIIAAGASLGDSLIAEAAGLAAAVVALALLGALVRLLR